MRSISHWDDNKIVSSALSKKSVPAFIDWEGWVENLGDIATSTVPLHTRVCTTVHPIPEHGIGLKQGHWGSWLLYPTIDCHGNQKPFLNKIINPTSPLFIQTTPSVHPLKITANGWRIYTTSLNPHSPTHQNSCGEVFLTCHNIKDNTLVLLWLNKIYLETGSRIHAKLMGEDLFCIASY